MIAELSKVPFIKSMNVPKIVTHDLMVFMQRDWTYKNIIFEMRAKLSKINSKSQHTISFSVRESRQ